MRSSTPPEVLNVCHLLPHLPEVLPALLRWRVAGVGATVQAKPRLDRVHATLSFPLPAVSDSHGGQLTQFASRPAASSSSSPSTALVPAVADAALDRDSASVSFALGKLFEMGADRRPVPVAALVGVSPDVVRQLQAMDVVKSDSGIAAGEQQLSLCMPSLFPCGAYALDNPVPAVRVYPDGPLLKLPRLRLRYLLHDDGWRPGEVPEGYVHGAQRVYNPSGQCPVSYYVALLEEARIFQQGLDMIKHGCRNGYYLCLLRLEGDPLLAALQDGEDQPEEHWRRALRGAQEPDTESSDDDDPAPPPPRPIGDLPPLPIADVSARVRAEEAGWARCWVSKGPLRTKVWFDHCSGPGGVRRGWCNCATHRCGKLKPVEGNRDYMAVAFLLWLEHGLDNEAMSRAEHMSWWPDDAAIRAAIPNCTFEPF